MRYLSNTFLYRCHFEIMFFYLRNSEALYIVQTARRWVATYAYEMLRSYYYKYKHLSPYTYRRIVAQGNVLLLNMSMYWRPLWVPVKG